MAREASPEVISFRSLFLPQGPLITLVGGTGGQRVGVDGMLENLFMYYGGVNPLENCVCVCVCGMRGGLSLGNPSPAVQKMCEEHMNYKSHLHKTCVSMCERVWNTKCIWKVWLEALLRFQPVNVGVLQCLHAQQLPVCSPCAHSCYLWRSPDKHIRMYSCRLRLCSQNCTISFSATGSLLKRLWEVVICIHQEKCNQ